MIKVVKKLLNLINSNITIGDEKILTDDRWLGDGYGTMSKEVLDAIRLAAQTDAILTDPTYSGKSIAGLIKLAQQNDFKNNANILYIHTGGHPGIFAYEALLSN